MQFARLAHPMLLAASGNLAFDLVFGAFVVAFAVLSVLALRFTFRRTAVRKQEFLERYHEELSNAQGRADVDGDDAGAGDPNAH